MWTGNTFVVWLKLGEFLLRSVELISESGRWKVLPDILDGDADGVVLFMRRGGTFATTYINLRWTHINFHEGLTPSEGISFAQQAQ